MQGQAKQGEHADNIHLDKIACTVMQFSDDSWVSAGDFNSRFIALNLTYLFKFLDVASFLHPSSAQQTYWTALQDGCSLGVMRFYLDVPLSQLTLLNAFAGLSERKRDDI